MTELVKLTRILFRMELRNFKISRLPMRIIAVSILITQLLFMLLQTVFVLAFAYLFLGARFTFTGTSWLCIPVVLVGPFAMLAVGFLVSARTGNARAATMIGNMINLVAIFLGGVFFPSDIWPKFMQPLTWINPLTWIVEALRKSCLYGTMDLAAFWPEIGAVSAIAVVCLVAGLKLFRYE